MLSNARGSSSPLPSPRLARLLLRRRTRAEMNHRMAAVTAEVSASISKVCFMPQLAFDSRTAILIYVNIVPLRERTLLASRGDAAIWLLRLHRVKNNKSIQEVTPCIGTAFRLIRRHSQVC